MLIAEVAQERHARSLADGNRKARQAAHLLGLRLRLAARVRPAARSKAQRRPLPRARAPVKAVRASVAALRELVAVAPHCFAVQEARHVVHRNQRIPHDSLAELVLVPREGGEVQRAITQRLQRGLRRELHRRRRRQCRDRAVIKLLAARRIARHAGPGGARTRNGAAPLGL